MYLSHTYMYIHMHTYHTPCIVFPSFFSSSLSPPHLLLVVGIKPGALPMLRKHLTTKIYPPLCLRYFYGKITFKKWLELVLSWKIWCNGGNILFDCFGGDVSLCSPGWPPPLVLLSLTSSCWDCRCTPPSLAHLSLNHWPSLSEPS